MNDEEFQKDEAFEREVVDEMAEARKSREIVTRAMIAASVPLANRDVRRRMLPGLWYSAVNTLIVSFDPEDVLRLMKDRIAAIRGTADNADADPRHLSPSDMQAYVREVVLAGQTISEALETAHEELAECGIEDRFAETVFDTALRVLVPAWGPDHVRRAIMEQSALLIRGQVAVHNFMEPSVVLDPASVRRREDSVPAAEPAHPGPQDFEFAHRTVRDRRVRIFIASDVGRNGRAAWAASMSVTEDGGRYEFRKMAGPLDDETGRRAQLSALHEACMALVAMPDRATVTIESGDDALLLAAGDPTLRNEAHGRDTAETWAEIEHAISMHDVSFRHAPAALTDPLQESCDHLLREFVR